MGKKRLIYSGKCKLKKRWFFHIFSINTHTHTGFGLDAGKGLHFSTRSPFIVTTCWHWHNYCNSLNDSKQNYTCFSVLSFPRFLYLSWEQRNIFWFTTTIDRYFEKLEWNHTFWHSINRHRRVCASAKI